VDLDLVKTRRPFSSFLPCKISQSIVFRLCISALRMIKSWIAKEISSFFLQVGALGG
jgi:hypothetical protein